MSNISTTSIDENYPVAGQDNPTQGFRDNFQSIKNNLDLAQEEITFLEQNSVLTGQTNDLADTIFANTTIKSQKDTFYNIGSPFTNLNIDLENGYHQYFTLENSIVSVVFSNLPTATDQTIIIKLAINVTDITKTITWGDNFVNLNKISNIVQSTTSRMQFHSTGIYYFEILLNGNDYYLFDRNKNSLESHANLKLVWNGATLVNMYGEYNVPKQKDIGVLIANLIITDEIVITDGSQVTGDVAGNVAGNVTGNVNGKITDPSQPDITQLGDLVELNVIGNVRLNTDANTANSTVVYGMFDACGPFMTTIRRANVLNAGTVTVTNTDNCVIINPVDGSGNETDISSCTIQMPDDASSGQRFALAFGSNVASVDWFVGATEGEPVVTSAGQDLGINLVWFEYPTPVAGIRGRYYRIG